jgi:hypothetical protein
MTPAQMIEKYLQLRQKLRNIEARHKLEIAPYLEIKERLEMAMLDHLNREGLDSQKCEAGTAFKSTVTSVTVSDWAKTLDFIRANEMWELLEGRVAKGAAVEIVQEREAPIPGVEISQMTVLRVRSG